MPSVTFSLPSFPRLSQLLEDPGHLYPNVNTHMDCVPTSIAAALTWFTGTQYLGDEIIDAVYGPTYTGGTAASRYAAYCATRGVKISPYNGTNAQLVQQLHIYLHQQKPTLVTVPGHWNDPATSGTNPGSVTHVMVVCGDGPGCLQVMNPWTGAFEVYSDSWFQTKLCYGQIWPMEKIPMVPSGWHDDGKTMTASNGIPLGAHFRQWILDNGWDANNVPVIAEHDWPGQGTRQEFRYSALGWNASGHVVYIWLGQELLDAKAQAEKAAQDAALLQSQIDTLNKQIAALKATQGAPTLPAALDAALAVAFSEWQKAKLQPVPAVTKPLPATSTN